jgi:hypothetical protein
MSPASFKIMDRTLDRTMDSDLDEIMIFQERNPSPDFKADPRYSAGYEEQMHYHQV